MLDLHRGWDLCTLLLLYIHMYILYYFKVQGTPNFWAYIS